MILGNLRSRQGGFLYKDCMSEITQCHKMVDFSALCAPCKNLLQSSHIPLNSEMDKVVNE